LAREYNPKILDALSDLAATAGEDYEFLSMFARKQFEKSVTISRGKVKIHLKSIRRQHPAIVRLILRQMMEVLTKDTATLTFDHAHALESLVFQNGSGVLDLPNHLKGVKNQEFLELSWFPSLP